MAYELQEARRLVLEAGHRMQRDGLIARTWGNISARISDTEMVITPSGRSYDSLVPEDIVRVHIDDGTWVEETAAGRKPVRPSSEKLVHMAIYQERPGVNFIIHTHQAYASALSVLGRDLGDSVLPCAAYGMNATRLLQDNVAAAVKRHPEARWVLMKNHGAVVFDSSYEAAAEDARALEMEAREEYRRLAGDVPEVSFGLTAAEADGCIRYREKLSFQDFLPGLCVWRVTSPVLRAASRSGIPMPAYLDDLAQISGPVVACAEEQTWMEEAGRRLGVEKDTALLVRGTGAICVGANEEETGAVAMVLEKNALAFLLAERRRQAGEQVAVLDSHAAEEDRKSYLEHYSKLMH
jgi:L-fuculose-phosphate aldolase